MQQFDASILSNEFQLEGYEMRPLESTDFKLLKLLSQLTTVGDISETQFKERFDWFANNNQYYCLVVQELASGSLVGSGTLLIEHKFIHSCGSVGHIEDIVVDASMRGKSLGKLIIAQLTHLAHSRSCYKVLLSCLEKNLGFYQKCDFVQKELAMAHYF